MSIQIQNSSNARIRSRLSLTLISAMMASLVLLPSSAANRTGLSRRETQVSESLSDSRRGESSVERSIAYGQTPLYFEANHGQTDSRVNFIARAGGATVFVTPGAAVFTLAAPSENSGVVPETGALDKGLRANATTRKMWAVRMNIEGANQAAQVQGQDEFAGIVNYFIGNVEANWHTDIPTFARVQYTNIYPGVDLVYYGNQRQLEYDFILQPGADAGKIALNFEGANTLALDPNGDLLIKTGLGDLRQNRPVVYQEVGGAKREVDGGYELKGGGRIGFRVGAYDRAKPLIIDPMLSYSTYLGSGDSDFGSGIAVDSLGNAYITGETGSTLFPTTPGAFDATDNPTTDIFVTKLNATGSGLVYSTYLGGDENDFGFGIALDSAGNAYVTGQTGANFPTTAGALATTANPSGSAFVTKLNPAGSVLVYSTYLGGNGLENGQEIALDVAGNAYVTGVTSSTNFPTTAGARDASFNGGSNDVFVSKLNASGSALVYSTYLGGSSGDFGDGIAVDSSGNAYVAGSTSSTNFPTTPGVFDTVNDSLSDVFVSKINPNISGAGSLVYSTYLGTMSTDIANGIAVDSAGNAYIVGSTSSPMFPTTMNSFQPMDPSVTSDDAFVTKLNDTGSGLVYSTYLGGGNTDIGRAIAVDAAGNAYVTGQTSSPVNFPTTADAFATTSVSTAIAAFATKINAAGSALAYSTYLSGFDDDYGNAIAVDSAGNMYVTGQTFSTDFPTTTSAFQRTFSGSSDGFIAKIGDFAIAGRVMSSTNVPIPTVTVSLTGSSDAVTQTDANGNFAFLDTATGGSYTVTPTKTGFTFDPSFKDFGLSDNRTLLFVGASTAPTPTPTPAAAHIQFEFANYIAPEDCDGIDIAVTRTGDPSSALTIDYATSDDTARQKSDYGISVGTLSFAPGDVHKTITLLITEDGSHEGDEKFTLNLFSLTGPATLEEPSRTTITITDDDPSGTTVNTIDDTEAFVCQHYHDFLNREPDTSGLLFWKNNIDSCGADVGCREVRRIDTSAAFFLSIEYQQTGFFAIRLQRVAFGKRSDSAAARVAYEQLVRDTRQIGDGVVVLQSGWEAKLEQNKQAYATQVVTSAEFISRFPTSQTAAQYVDALYASAQVSPTTTERNDAITAFAGGSTGGRVAALRKVADSQSIVNAEFSPAFVLLQYHGYLRRNPTDLPDTNDSGYQFWLTKLNAFGGDYRAAELVKAFLSSAEYRQRFGPS